MNKKNLFEIVAVFLVFILIFSPISNSIQLKSNEKYIKFKNEFETDEIESYKSDTQLTKYWGCPDLKFTNGTNFFDTYKDENGVWWFVTPNGYAFYSAGRELVNPFCRRMYEVNTFSKYNGNYYAWAEKTTERFKDWGLNTVGAWSAYEYFEEIPYIYTFIFRFSGHFKWNQNVRGHPDVFDSDWWEIVENNINEVTENLKDDKYLIGYYLDNEINWGTDFKDTETLLEEYLSVPYEDHRPGKYAVVEFLKERYENNGGIEEFREVWDMEELKCWDELYDRKSLGREGWRVQSNSKLVKMKLYKEEPKLEIKPELLERADSDIRAFNRLVAECYYENITRIIRAHDLNHLIFSDRFHGQGVPEEVLEICGIYCNVTSINYYRDCLYFYRPSQYFKWHKFNVVPLINWMKEFYENTKKPIIVCEWGRNSILGPFGHEWVIPFDKITANYNTRFAKKCLETPYIIGHQGWYLDQLVDENDDEIDVFVDDTEAINRQIYEIHKSCMG